MRNIVFHIILVNTVLHRFSIETVRRKKNYAKSKGLPLINGSMGQKTVHRACYHYLPEAPYKSLSITKFKDSDKFRVCTKGETVLV